MPDSKNYKGQWCFIKPVICQKGHCKECTIYQDISQVFSTSLETTDSTRGILDKAANTEIRQKDIFFTRKLCRLISAIRAKNGSSAGKNPKFRPLNYHSNRL